MNGFSVGYVSTTYFETSAKNVMTALGSPLPLINNNKGISLVYVLVFSGAIMIALMPLLNYLNQASRINASVEEKIQYNNYQGLAYSTMASSATCSCNVSGLTFDENRPTSHVSLNRLVGSCGVNPEVIFAKAGLVQSRPEMIVSDLYLSSFVTTGIPNEFTAKIYIIPPTIPSRMQAPVIPISVTVFTSKVAGSTINTILGCGQTPLTVPSNLTATLGDSSCSFGWVPSVGAGPITYQVRMATSPNSTTTGTVVCNTDQPVCTVNSLTNGSTYYFSIQAINYNGISAFSPEVSCRPISMPCPLPWGGQLASGTSVLGYQSNSAASSPSGVCVSELRNCASGVLSGSFQYSSCH